MKIHRTDTNAFVIDIDARGKDFEQWVMLRSDAHHDNAHCREELEKEHLEEAREKKAIILDGGDLFCAMQGRHDKRRSEEALKNKFRGKPNFFDLIVDDAFKFYKPYADMFAMLGMGNHETSVLKNNGINLTEQLARRLHTECGSNVVCGAYTNYIRLNFRLRDKAKRSVTIYQNHGHGGGGVVTDGVIQFKRLVCAHEADMYWMGHIHKMNTSTHIIDSMDKGGNIVQRKRTFVRTSTYKDEHGKGLGGWSVEKGMGPVPLGCTWLRFRKKGDNILWQVTESGDI